MPNTALLEAEYYEIIDGDEQKIQCHLCPHECRLDPKDKGICKARMNIEGKLYSLTYGYTDMKIDLIEKQNVYHFLPTSRAQTFATYNCNLDCSFCPVPERAHVDAENINAKKLSPDQAVMFATASGARIVSFGESEPLISFEWVRDTAKLAKEKGLKVILRTNGYFNEAPIREILEYVDAVRINIKAADTEGYLKLCGGGNFEHIQRIVKIIHESEKLVELAIVIHEELGNTIDSAEKIAEWIVNELSKDIPLHLARLKPSHRVKNLVPTTKEVLETALKAVKKQSLHYVYLDNVPDHKSNNTICHSCGEELIIRTPFTTEVRRISLQGKCNKCQTQLNIIMN